MVKDVFLQNGSQHNTFAYVSCKNHFSHSNIFKGQDPCYLVLQLNCGVVVQCIDFSPIMWEPSIQFHAGDKSSAMLDWTISNRGWTNVGLVWRYQWTFQQPQKDELLRSKRQEVRSQLQHKCECVYAWNKVSRNLLSTIGNMQKVILLNKNIYKLITPITLHMQRDREWSVKKSVII